MNQLKLITALLTISFFHINCNKSITDVTQNPPSTQEMKNEVDIWLTDANKSVLFQKQKSNIVFTKNASNFPVIEVDSTITFQTVDGYGYTLTGGSAMLINKMEVNAQNALLEKFFGTNDNSINVNYLRLSIGASDLDEDVFSYDDLESGSDEALNNFTLSKDTIHLIPILKKILKINPNIKIMASPWSPPIWMKDNKKSIGGSLLPKYYTSYANYFVKYITAMKIHGIVVDAITIQNEPQHGGNNPSMVMSASQQSEFIKNHLGPIFKANNIETKIIIWDHNCDNAQYPISILDDVNTKQYIDGSAFHLYNGDISALSIVKTAHPDKNLYFTEQWTGSNSSFDGDLKWHIKNVIIGSMRNWSKTALEWNLANDLSYKPHTIGGCTECKGAVTINGNEQTLNIAYYIIAHASKFVHPNSKRIHSSFSSTLLNVAFLTPQGKKVLIVLNEQLESVTFNIKNKDLYAEVIIPAESVGTFVW